MEPIRAEGILVEVTSEHEAEEIYVYALDNHSVIKTILEVTRVQDTSPIDNIAIGKKLNRFSFSLDPKYETICYLVSTEELY